MNGMGGCCYAILSALRYLLSEGALDILLLQCLLTSSLESTLLLLQVLPACLLCGLQRITYHQAGQCS